MQLHLPRRFSSVSMCVTHISVGGGRQVGWSYKTELVSIHSKNAGIYSPIVGLTELWALLPEIKDEASECRIEKKIK